MAQADPSSGGPLILGSTGAVGRALAQVWPDDRPALWQHRPGASAPRTPSLAWDILHSPAPSLPRPVTGIVHLARGADTATEVALAQAACDLGAARGVPVLIASSQAVYGPARGLVDEDTPPDPVNAYGAAKLAMERATAGRACLLRIGNVAGCDMLLGNAARGRVTLDRLPDGTSPARSYLSVPDLMAVLLGLLGQGGDLPGVLNVARPGPVAMADLLAAAGLDWDWRTAPATALARLELDVTRLMARVPLPRATPAALIAGARAAGWRAVR